MPSVLGMSSNPLLLTSGVQVFTRQPSRLLTPQSTRVHSLPPSLTTTASTGNLFSWFAFSRNDYQLAIQLSKQLECQLTNGLGAKGKGLREKVSPAETQLSAKGVRALRYVANLRNQLVHDEHMTALPDHGRFITCFEPARAETPPMPVDASSRSPRPLPRCICLSVTSTARCGDDRPSLHGGSLLST